MKFSYVYVFLEYNHIPTTNIQESYAIMQNHFRLINLFPGLVSNYCLNCWCNIAQNDDMWKLFYVDFLHVPFEVSIITECAPNVCCDMHIVSAT